MYDVELGSIWIWKFIESCFENLFEQWLNFFKKKTFHNKNKKLWEHLGFVCYMFQCILNYVHVHIYQHDFSLIEHDVPYIGIGCLIFY